MREGFFVFSSFHKASSRQWALPPHNLRTKYQEKCQPSVLVELLPTRLTLTTHKKVSEESASLQADGLVSTAHHSTLRSGYLPQAVGHSPRGCRLARDLEGNVHPRAGCTSYPGAWGVCPAGSHTSMSTGNSVCLFVSGAKKEKQKRSARRALAKTSMSAMCCLHFSLDQLELGLDEYYLPNILFSKCWSSLLNMLFD